MPSFGRYSRRSITLAAALAVVTVLAGAGCSGQTDRQATVSSIGAEVMPFDLARTTHTFTKTDSGGVQLITVKDPTDQTQIDLIRRHLRTERENFATGNFSDPARIHGMDMPGTSELSEGYARVDVTYMERPDGAELTYTTGDSQLVAAVHAWFDRQVMDHGADATSG